MILPQRAVSLQSYVTFVEQSMSFDILTRISYLVLGSEVPASVHVPSLSDPWQLVPLQTPFIRIGFLWN
jgi:hypothetical protein